MSDSFKQIEAFPVIVQLIVDLKGDSRGYRSHAAIASALVSDPSGLKLIEDARSKSSFKDDYSIASNMVQWFSQRISVDKSPWTSLFEREKQSGTWAYRPTSEAVGLASVPSDLSAIEGEPRLILHYRRERCRKLANAKRDASRTPFGSLICEACDADSRKTFPHIAADIWEVHHRSKLGDADKPITTSLEDLAILCPTCHRAIHQTKPLNSVEQFRAHHLIAKALSE